MIRTPLEKTDSGSAAENVQIFLECLVMPEALKNLKEDLRLSLKGALKNC